jgi:hypothetical protein
VQEYIKSQKALFVFIDVPVKQRKSDEELAQEVKGLLNGQPIGILQSLDIEQRNEIVPP